MVKTEPSGPSSIHGNAVSKTKTYNVRGGSSAVLRAPMAKLAQELLCSTCDAAAEPWQRKWAEK